MIGFAQIAGGMPSSVGSMTDHLLNQTLNPEQAALAAYYGRGMVQDCKMLNLAKQVGAGEIAYSQALDTLMASYRDDGGDGELLKAAEDRIGKRLADLAFRAEQGLLDAPLAVVRLDAHPLALEGLGIEADGMLSRDEINALLAGRRADGDLVEGKRYVKERHLPVDPKTREVRMSLPIGSYDFCPTPDKTVSVAWGFASPVEQAMIYNAHIEAAREAVGLIADEVGKVRLGDGGKDGSEPGHIAWLEFTHHTSRRVQVTTEKDGAKITADAGFSGDPDLHTHFLIPNAVFSETGKVGSLDTAAVAGFIFVADTFYHARLATKLRDAGFDVALDDRTGAARMTIIPEAVRSLFSKRTNMGEALARTYTVDQGEVWDELSDDQRQARMKAATQSAEQKQKGDKDDVANVADWRRQAKETTGWEPGPSLQLYGPQQAPLTPDERIRQAYDVALPHLAEKLGQKSVIKHWDLQVAALRGLVQTGTGPDGMADMKAVTRIMAREGVQQNGAQTAIVLGQEEGLRYQSVTTTLHQSDEREFIQLAKQAAADKHFAISDRLLKRTVAASGLDFSDDHGKAQLAGIQRLASGGKFSMMVAAAGAGKSSALKPLVAAWTEQHRDVWGASLAWRQSDDLVDAGINARNLAAFSVLLDGLRAAKETPDSKSAIKLSQASVVAVDEWGLLGTRQGLELMRHRAEIGFTIVALGDPKQCASIEAGPIIDLSRRALGTEQVPEILTTKRQKSERERDIVGLLREGKAADALDMKRADGTAELAYGGRAGVIKRVAALYRERLEATGQAPGINAPTNQDAHDISAAVRLERRALGLVGADTWTVPATDGTRDYSLPLAPGDRVRLFKSTGATYTNGRGEQARARGGPIGRNGTVLEVIEANAAGLTVKNDRGRVGVVDWNKLAHGDRIRLAYGDAMTIHTAQGSSRSEQISAFPDGTDRVVGQQAYSALTRHVHASHLVSSEQAERIDVQKRRPLNDPRDITVEDKWANVARSFAHQPEKDSATALLERVGQLRHGGIKVFHQAVLPAEPGHRVGHERSLGSKIVQGIKLDAGLSRSGQALKQSLQMVRQTVRQAQQSIARHVGFDRDR